MSLSEPEFVSRDPAAITAELVSWYEAQSGKTLYPAQVERLFINMLAYRETLLREALQDAAKQNLVAFARAPMLDYLAQLVGVTRLEGELDEALRARVILAPEGFTTAGSRGAYRFHTLSVDARIVDVAVMTPGYGEVRVFPLLNTGLPDAALLARVQAALSDERVRPLTETVRVLCPEPVVVAAQVVITPVLGVDVTALVLRVQEAVAGLCGRLRATLGLDWVPSQVVAALSVDGVYQVQLLTATLPQVLERWQWLDVTLELQWGAAHER